MKNGFNEGSNLIGNVRQRYHHDVVEFLPRQHENRNDVLLQKSKNANHTHLLGRLLNTKYKSVTQTQHAPK